jgi:hypothetical protein
LPGQEDVDERAVRNRRAADGHIGHELIDGRAGAALRTSREGASADTVMVKNSVTVI